MLRLAEHLRGGRHTLEQLAGEFHVTTRTVRRDLEALSVAGVPVRKTLDTGDGFPSHWWVVSA